MSTLAYVLELCGSDIYFVFRKELKDFSPAALALLSAPHFSSVWGQPCIFLVGLSVHRGSRPAEPAPGHLSAWTPAAAFRGRSAEAGVPGPRSPLQAHRHRHLPSGKLLPHGAPPPFLFKYSQLFFCISPALRRSAVSGCCYHLHGTFQSPSNPTVNWLTLI